MNSSALADGMVKIPRIRLKGSNNKQQKSSNNTSSSSSGGGHGHVGHPPPPQSAIHVDQIRSVNLKHIGPVDHHRNNQHHHHHIHQRHNNSGPTAAVLLTNHLQNHHHHIHQKMNSSSKMSSGGGGAVVSAVPAFKESSDSDEDSGMRVTSGGGQQQMLIKPKKLPNPIKESVAMQNIHKELLLNQKIGRSVLTHKTELQKALEKLATKQSAAESPSNEYEDDDSGELSSLAPNPPPMPNSKHPNNKCSVVNNNKKNEFQRILDQRAKLIEDQKCFVDGEKRNTGFVNESEFEKIHKRITTSHQFHGGS